MGDIILELPFLGGIDQSTREEVVSPAESFTSLENVRYVKYGGVSKRPGFAALSKVRLNGTSRSAGHRLFSSGEELVTIDGTTLDVYSAATGRSSTKGLVPEASQRPIPIPSLATSQSTVTDTVSVGAYTVVSWAAVALETIAGVPTQTLTPYVSVLDSASGAVIRNPEKLGLAILSGQLYFGARLGTYSTYVIAVVQNGANLGAYYLNTASASTINAGWTFIVNIANNLQLGQFAHVVSLAASVAVIYGNTIGGTSRLSVKTVTAAGPTASVLLNTNSVTPMAFNLVEGSATLWAAWDESGAIKAQGLNPVGLSTTVTKGAIFSTSGGALEDLFLAPMGASDAAIYVNTIVNSYAQAIHSNAGAAATNGTTALLGGSKIVSRPFTRNGLVYAHWTSKGQTELVLCDCTPDITGASGLSMYLRPVAVPVVRGLFSSPGGERVTAIDVNRYVYGYTITRTGTTKGSAMALYDFADPERWKPAEVSGVTFLGGGVTSVVDPTRVFEAGFLCAPQRANPIASLSGALTFTLGGRSYVYTFADEDANGDLHLSGVGLPTISGNVSSKLITHSMYPLSITSRGSVNGSNLLYGSSIQGSLRILIWGTMDGGEPPYYLVGECTNDPGQSQVVFYDNVTDAVLATKPLLYGTGNLPTTNGAGQDHRAPPGLSHIVSYNGMLIGASGKQLFFSSQPIDGEGQWFSPVFSQILDDDVTALDVMDGSLVVFMKRRIYVMGGEPPNDTGTQGGLGVARRLAVDVGSIDGQTVATSKGIFFRSDRGIDILTRGFSVEFIGQGIQDELASFPIISAMELDSKNNIVRISLAESRDSAGLVSGDGHDVVYDLVIDKWLSIDRKTGSAPDQPTQDAAMVFYGDAWRYGWLAADGTVYVERLSDDASKCLDGSTWIDQVATTPWVHIAGLQGEQFVDGVLLLAKSITDHDITIALAYDYSDSFTSSKTFTAAQVAALAREWLVKEVSQTTNNAIRVQITDATPSSGTVGTGEGATWVCLTFSGQPHRGPKRTTAAQRGGT
jgi:hypothetical protein